MRLIHKPMKIVEDDITIGESQLTKKLWASPLLMLVGTNAVNSGAAPGIHEKHVTNSVLQSGGIHRLDFDTRSPYLAFFTKNHYHS
jgi:hypothetical protein